MKNQPLALTALAFSSLLTLTACQQRFIDNAPTVPQAKAQTPAIIKTEKPANNNSAAIDHNLTSTTKGINQVVAANNQFAIDLYQQLNNQPEQAKNNVFFSPYSLSTAIAMLYNAADGETKSQIQKTFHYPALNILNPNSAALYNQFNKPNPNYELTSANDLWLSQDLTPNPSYVDTVKRYYGGQVANLDFKNRPEPSRQLINKTVANHTKQMIPELLGKGSITRDTTAVLTNAVYFKSEWQQPLALKNGLQPFYNLDGTTSSTNLMRSLDRFNYMEDGQVQVIELPYKGGELSMMIVLPTSKQPSAMQTLVKNLTANQISQWSQQLEPKKISLLMPKFKLEESYQMTPLLKKMGMPIAFSNRADFSLFNDKIPLAIDDVVHKAVVEVDEKGTVAAALTGVVVVIPVSASYNAEFIADHPFMFMIKDKKSEAILFLGQVNQL